MPTNRSSDPIGVRFRIPGPFDWMGEQDISALRGGNDVVRTIQWTNGDPPIANFAISHITRRFWSDSSASTEITSSHATLWSIGDQTLEDLITLENFVSNGNASGTVDIRVSGSGITESELSAMRNIWLTLQVSQPDPGEE